MQFFSSLASRVRMPLLFLGIAGVWLLGFFDFPIVLRYFVFAGFCTGLMVQWLVPPPQRASVDLTSLFKGRWQVYNSPSTKVPSHGTHAWAQTFAVDFVFDPPSGTRPGYGDGKAIRPPGDYPGFGQPILSPIDGEVVVASDSARDHGSRNSTAGRWLMMLEGIRELGGPALLIGNHVILKHTDGRHILLAHLKRGSVDVRAGDKVRAGDEVAACGNSGNSSEPHLHLQVMDKASTWIAIPLPFTINGASLPKSGEWLEADCRDTSAV